MPESRTYLPNTDYQLVSRNDHGGCLSALAPYDDIEHMVNGDVIEHIDTSTGRVLSRMVPERSNR